MKKRVQHFLLQTLLATVLFAGPVMAQPPNPPDPPGHGQGGNQGKGAPIDGGIATSLLLVAGYGAWKAVRSRRK